MCLKLFKQPSLAWPCQNQLTRLFKGIKTCEIIYFLPCWLWEVCMAFHPDIRTCCPCCKHLALNPWPWLDRSVPHQAWCWSYTRQCQLMVSSSQRLFGNLKKHNSGQFHKLVCALRWTVCSLCSTFESLSQR